MKRLLVITMFTIMFNLIGCDQIETGESVTYTVTFHDNGGSTVEAVEVEDGKSFVEPTQPTYEGKTFIGWYSDSTLNVPYDFSKPVLGDLNLYANWVSNEYALTFELNNELEPVVEAYFFEDAITAIEDPEKEGYDFGGWFTDEELTTEYVFSTMPSGDMTLYAKWEPKEYTVNIFGYGEVRFDMIETGYYHAIGVTTSGEVLQWGAYGYGNESEGVTNLTEYFEFEVEETVIELSLRTQSFVLTNQGRLFAWGDNDDFQLCMDTNQDFVEFPVDITDEFDLAEGEIITQVANSSMHTVVLTSENRVFGCGVGYEGSFGYDVEMLETATDITSHIPLLVDETIVDIDAGELRTTILTSENRMLATGNDDMGALGNEDSFSSYEYIDITANFNLGTEETFVSLGANYMNSGVLTSEGRVLTWGFNMNNALGTGDDEERQLPTDITANLGLQAGESVEKLLVGAIHMVAFTTNGRVLIWGSNETGELGIGDAVYDYIVYDITNQFIADEEIELMSEFGITVFAQTTDGTIFAWGLNEGGQALLDPEIQEVMSPTVINQEFTDTLAITDTMQVYYLDDVVMTETQERLGHTFIGWCLDIACNNPLTDMTMPAHDINLYPHFELNSYVVTFVVDGEVVDTVEVEFGTPLTFPEVVVEMHYFDGWFLDELFQTPFTGGLVSEDLTLYGKFEEIDAYQLTNLANPISGSMPAGETKWFTFTLTEAQTYIISVDADFPPLVTLYDSSLSVISSSFGSGIYASLEPGTYFIEITDYASLGGGYTLTIGESTATGDLIVEDVYLGYGEEHVYEFVVTQTTVVTMYTVSDLDTWGELYDENWNMITQNDDNQGLDFGIEIVLEPGVYYILVRGIVDDVEGFYDFYLLFDY